MSIVIKGLSFHYDGQKNLFKDINLSIKDGEKVGIIGDNGVGKSTFLQLISGEIHNYSGNIFVTKKTYYIPQNIVLFSGKNISHLLQIDKKIHALKNIYDGSVDIKDYDILGNDWEIEREAKGALAHYGLSDFGIDYPVKNLSGGEKLKVLLAGMSMHNPEIILLDEPTNHIDLRGRKNLYEYIKKSNATIVIVSHDISLLNTLDKIIEITSNNIHIYGGNYIFYKSQKNLEKQSLEEKIENTKIDIGKDKKNFQKIVENQEKRSSRGKKVSLKGGIPKIKLHKMKNNSENTTGKIKKIQEKIMKENIEKLEEFQNEKEDEIIYHIDVSNIALHAGKILFQADGINYHYLNRKNVFSKDLTFEIRSQDRIQILGENGSGKTTLISLIIHSLLPTKGKFDKKDFSYIYLDQEYSALQKDMSLIDFTKNFNTLALADSEVKKRLHRAGFSKETWNKNIKTLSSGEKMRLYLCCIIMGNNAPLMIILDEPTNNLDLRSISILTQTIKSYTGTILVVSHDENFIHQIGINKIINLDTYMY